MYVDNSYRSAILLQNYGEGNQRHVQIGFSIKDVDEEFSNYLKSVYTGYTRGTYF